MTSNEQIEDQIAQLLAAWEDAYSKGVELTPNELCEKSPQLVEEIESRIFALKQMQWMTKDVELQEDDDSTEAAQFLNKILAQRYQLNHHLGSGGFGHVFEAHDNELHRDVAIKIARCEVEPSNRTLNEARLSARLIHANIVRIYDVGTFENRCFIVSELICGKTLEEEIADGQIGVSKATEIVEGVAAALQHAHYQGIVHLDVKPSNVLLSSNGEPKLTDFGISQTIETINAGESPLGTAAFMSPEQIRRSPSLNKQSDIFSLGVLFYHMLTQKLPFEAKLASHILREIESGKVVSPRRLRPDIPAHLERACLRCLQANPDERFESANDFSNSLNAKHSLFNKRNWLLSVLGLVIALGLFLAFSSWHLSKKNPLVENQIVLTNGHATDLAASPDGKLLAGSNVSSLIHIWDMKSKQQVFEFDDHWEWGRSVCFSPDGKFIVSGSGGLMKNGRTNIGNDHSIRIWDKNGRILGRLKGHSESVVGLAISPDSRLIASASDDSTIRIWDAATLQQVNLLESHTGHVMEITYAGTELLSGGDDGILRIWNVEQAKCTRSIQAHQARIWSVDSSPNHELFATGSVDTYAIVRDAESLAVVAKCKHPKTVRSIKFSSDGKTLITGCHDGKIRMWDSNSGELIRIVGSHTGEVLSVCVIPNSTMIASSSNDGTIKFWDTGDEEGSTHEGDLADKPEGVLFDGKSRVISPLQSFAPCTIEVWIAPNRDNEQQFVVGSDVPHKFGIGLGIRQGQPMVETIRGGFHDRARSVPLHRWSHLSAVYAKDQTRLYLNGEMIMSGPATQIPADDFSKFVVGNVGENHSNMYFSGHLRSVRISIGERYKNDFTPNQTLTPDIDTVLLYDESSFQDDKAIDLSGNRNNGDWIFVPR